MPIYKSNFISPFNTIEILKTKIFLTKNILLIYYLVLGIGTRSGFLGHLDL